MKDDRKELFIMEDNVYVIGLDNYTNSKYSQPELGANSFFETVDPESSF